ncbi:MAG: polyhydroxyalkanoic acid system family protein [Myxococcales bacterium]|nr:polyhydroxyalkanoic acid system family protein [Myxococcales bacterium]
MGMLHFEVTHSLSREEAKKRVEALLSYWSRKYGMKAEWTGESAQLSGKAMGISINAHLTVQDGKVGGDASDPGILLRAQAQKYLTRKFGHYLDPSRSLEELKGLG